MSTAQLILDLEVDLERAIIERRCDDAIELMGRLRILRDTQRAKEFIASRRAFRAIIPNDIRSN